jgi:hypothetical protein
MTPPNTNRPSLDPHGYQPLVIDESVLSPEERHEIFVYALSCELGTDSWGDWQKHLTPEELHTYKTLAEKYRLGPATKELG